MMKAKVLIIDDEEAIRSSLKMIFEYEGYDCLLAANGAGGAQDRRARSSPTSSSSTSRCRRWTAWRS